GGTTMPRITASHMLRSTMKTVSAPASSSFRGSLPHPTQPLCTLRVRRRRRLTQHSLPGGPLRPYLGRTRTGSSHQLCWRLPSFDHLVGKGQQFVCNLQAERLCGPQTSHELANSTNFAAT